MRIGSFDGIPWNYGIHGVAGPRPEETKQEVKEVEKPDPRLQEPDSKLDFPPNVKKTGPLKLQDVSLDKNVGSSFEYIGKDSDLFSLDVQKAVSDMKRDRILEDYQYFVGDIHKGEKQPENNRVKASEIPVSDGIVVTVKR